ncbi:HAD-IA family hydrolase [Nucisporomicrobium flavum]|uniref:HAD-IA family hydrolase n=1 Tax=Nucisporomicrobium flavum TaxID=2785915 RepID=UPI0018F33D46|nr:HAD-IA family hydrolase [Nucisporomicrobium flavum]
MPAIRARQLLIDFGEVISLAQPAAAVAALAVDAGLPAAEFTARYWAHRPGYDRGASALGYWTAVLGHEPGKAQLRRLVARDVASWLHLDAGTLALLDQVHATGVPMSLLSNAPRELARELERHPALRPFAHLLFSADLSLVKPDTAIFTAALGALGAAPADVVFVDDRADNVAAAAALGLRACLFTATSACRAEIFTVTAGMSQLAA